jgi:hypothetical protein
MTTPTKPDLSILAELLGQIDSLWRPPRGPRLELPARAVVDEMQRAFIGVGLPVHIPPGDDAERKQIERRFAKLEGEGLIRIQRRRNRVGVRLVDSVDWDIRARVGFTFAECLAAMLRLAECEAEGLFLPFASGRWVPEGILANVPWNWNTEEQQGRIIDTQDRLAGALCRRWVVANSCFYCRAWYTLTPAGRNVLENPPDLSGCECRYDSELNDRYGEGYDTMNQIVETAKPRHPGHIGLIPLPASAWEHNEKLFAEFDRLEKEAAATSAGGNGCSHGNGKPI